MGMYTRLYLACNLKKADETDIKILKAMVEGEGRELTIPPEKNHKLFNTERWTFFLSCDSFYFDHVSNSVVEEKGDETILVADCDFKNYGGVLDAFLDWIKPLSTTTGFVGFHQYEENDEPTLIYW